jgi:hypothetical protein
MWAESRPIWWQALRIDYLKFGGTTERMFDNRLGDIGLQAGNVLSLAACTYGASEYINHLNLLSFRMQSWLAHMICYNTQRDSAPRRGIVEERVAYNIAKAYSG